jgi:hypothetical protein
MCCGMVITGAVYHHPDANPEGSSSAGHIRKSAKRPAQSGGSSGDTDTSRPWTGRIAAAGSSASSASTDKPTEAHERHRSGGPHRTGPQIAPAATEVVSDGGDAVTTRVERPASASEMAVVRPTTPAPTTSASTAVMPQR